MYYYGARYYDPRTSVWQSADPILGKYLPGAASPGQLPGMGGIYNSKNLGFYGYSHQCPVVYGDPDGQAVAAELALGVLAVAIIVTYVAAANNARDPELNRQAAESLGNALAAARDNVRDLVFNENSEDRKNGTVAPPLPIAGSPVLPPPEDPNDDKNRAGSQSEQPQLYRGGDKLTARPIDMKIDPKTGLVQPGRGGLSLNADPTKLSSQFGSARPVQSVPKELQIIQQGRPGHYVISPRQAMTPERFQELLNQVKLGPPA